VSEHVFRHRATGITWGLWIKLIGGRIARSGVDPALGPILSEVASLSLQVTHAIAGRAHYPELRDGYLAVVHQLVNRPQVNVEPVAFVITEVVSVPTDFQPEVVALGLMDWIRTDFDPTINLPSISYRRDKNRYVVDWKL
jgi:hypothetical protein